VESAIGTLAGFEQEDADLGVLRQARGQHAPGAATAHHHKIEAAARRRHGLQSRLRHNTILINYLICRYI
jgi:hypothetical protein